MQGNKGTIDIQQAFGCLHCQKVAFEPFIYSCCETIICQRCVQSGLPCPKCNKYGSIKLSQLILSIYRFVAYTCPYGCLAQLPLNQVNKHMQACPEATVECNFCKETPKIKDIPFHLGEKHEEECSRLLNEFNNKPSEDRKVGQELAGSTKKIQPFKVGTTGIVNLQPRLGQHGRIICGKPLPKNNSGSLFKSTSSSFFGKSEEVCSTQNGSCESCMEMDISRLGLPKFHLLNLQGRICRYLPDKQLVMCGCGSSSKTCGERVQCHPCVQLFELIKRGLYQNFIR